MPADIQSQLCLKVGQDIRSIQIKATLRYYYTPIRMAKVKKKVVIIPKADENVAKLGHPYTAGGHVKWCSHSGQQFGRVL